YAQPQAQAESRKANCGTTQKALMVIFVWRFLFGGRGIGTAGGRGVIVGVIQSSSSCSLEVCDSSGSMAATTWVGCSSGLLTGSPASTCSTVIVGAEVSVSATTSAAVSPV